MLLITFISASLFGATLAWALCIAAKNGDEIISKHHKETL